VWTPGGGEHPSGVGRVRLGALLFILVVVAGIYLAIKFIPPYWTYLSMKDPVKEAAMAILSATDEKSVRADLIRRAKQQGLAIDDENIEITREGTMLVIRVTWVEPVELPRYRYDLRFLVEERVPLR
jgi:hypothetical protein